MMWGLNDVLTYSIAYGMGEEEGRAKAEKEKKKESPWHTGTPTEDGQYLVYCDDGIGADVDDYENGRWKFYGEHVKAWAIIYVPLWLKEKNNG